jgi:hypothetical protein
MVDSPDRNLKTQVIPVWLRGGIQIIESEEHTVVRTKAPLVYADPRNELLISPWAISERPPLVLPVVEEGVAEVVVDDAGV